MCLCTFAFPSAPFGLGNKIARKLAHELGLGRLGLAGGGRSARPAPSLRLLVPVPRGRLSPVGWALAHVQGTLEVLWVELGGGPGPVAVVVIDPQRGLVVAPHHGGAADEEAVLPGFAPAPLDAVDAVVPRGQIPQRVGRFLAQRIAVASVRLGRPHHAQGKAL